MKNIRVRSLSLYALGLLALALQGCGLKWQVVQDPFPNYHLIERRANFQDQQIGDAVQQDRLVRPVAQALSDNIALVRQLAWQYQNPEGGQTMDLTAPQTRFLGILLNDNQTALNDALTRQSQWADAFQGGWNYNFNYAPDRRLYIAVLHHQLVEQEAMVEDGGANGSLNQAQVAELRARIRVIREAEWDDYNRNGGLDLTREQMEELSSMVDDNYRYLKFRSQYQDRRWSGDRFHSWGQYQKTYSAAPTKLPASSPTFSHKYWDGRPVKAALLHPTPTPVHQKPVWGRPSQPTATPVPPAPPPSFTPVPPAPTPSFTPVPAPPAQGPDHDHGNQGDHGLHKGWGQGQGNLGKDHEKDALSEGPQGNDQGQHKDQGKHLGEDQNKDGSEKEREGKDTKKIKADVVEEGSSKPETKSEKDSPWIGPDDLNKRFDGLKERMKRTKFKGPQKVFMNHKENDFRQTLDRDLQKNSRKGLTQDQVDQLNKMLDNIEKDLPAEKDQ